MRNCCEKKKEKKEKKEGRKSKKKLQKNNRLEENKVQVVDYLSTRKENEFQSP